MNDSTPPEGKRRFKETRALVRMALDDGMTQTEIARICRTQQSTVSMWANGERKAFEHQVEPLLARYGRQLRRISERVYLVEGPAWEGSEWARMFAEARPEYEALEVQLRRAMTDLRSLAAKNAQRSNSAFDDEQRAIPGGEIALAVIESVVETMNACLKVLADATECEVRWVPASKYQAIARGAVYFDGHDRHEGLAAQEELAMEQHALRQRALVAVEGPIVFRHVFAQLTIVAPRHGSPRLQGEPAARWLVHVQSQGTFMLVRQGRLTLPARFQEQWRQAFAGAPDVPRRLKTDVHSPDDDARWLSTIEGPMDLEALLARADRFAVAPEGFATVHDQLTLPFRLRKALIEHGYPVPGLRRIGAS